MAQTHRRWWADLSGLIALFLAIFACPGTTWCQGDQADFAGARWIWHSSMPDQQVPAGAVYFRGTFDLSEDPRVSRAELRITADNLFALYVNGQFVGESAVNNSAWQQPVRFDVKDLMRPGRNAIAVEGVNTLPGPAGLIVKLEVEYSDGQRKAVVSDEKWKCTLEEQSGWFEREFTDDLWNDVDIVGAYGQGPWGAVRATAAVRSPGGKPGAVHRAGQQAVRAVAAQGRVIAVREVADASGAAWPEAIVFIDRDCSLYRPAQKTSDARDSLSVTIFNPRNSRGFPEHDLPAPMKVGRRLVRLEPRGPDGVPQVIIDAGKGALGSPSVSYDGQWIYFSMVREGEGFFHLYRIPAAGGKAEQLTDGPFHDIDPCELPDGRLVFTSTRIGTYEEYHNPPSRSLFVLGPNQAVPEPLTHTLIFDNEPEVLNDGRILLIRSDNFFDRGKVETRLHAMHPDGTDGYTEFGLEMGPDYGGRLRAFVCGSPAPMPDGRVAFVSAPGITVGRLGSPAQELRHIRLPAGDVASLPDGRLLCTLGENVTIQHDDKGSRKAIKQFQYRRIAVLDLESQPATLLTLYQSKNGPIHSPVFLGSRRRAPLIASRLDPHAAEQVIPTGILYCQNARFTLNHLAGWPHVRAIRVLAAKGLTNRSSHSYIVHAGSEVVELGTVPLAPDGSFAVEVPADTPIAFQAVDPEGRSELNEMSWIYVRPGERRGCVGCHQPRQATPDPLKALPLALRTKPLKLTGQGNPLRFRGNNAAVTGLMELQFDRFREIAGINRFGQTEDPNVSVNDEVAVQVEELGHSDPWRRLTATQRLAVFRDPSGAKALVDCLTDQQREVRVGAAMALAACGTRASVPSLVTALGDPDPLVAQAASVALENLTGHQEPHNLFAGRAVRQRAQTAWRRWLDAHPWDRIEQHLISRLNSGDRDVVRRAAVALARTGGPTARDALRKVASEMAKENPFPEWRRDGRRRGDAARFNAVDAVNPRSLQAVVRALGWLRDEQSVPFLLDVLASNRDPETANLFLAEAAVEALDRIGTPQAVQGLGDAFLQLPLYSRYTLWYGDHPALMACHASPVHSLIIEALQRRATPARAPLITPMIQSLPIDPDRALLFECDDYETLVGRAVRRWGWESQIVEACLKQLGDSAATDSSELVDALVAQERCWAGHPNPAIRAAQVLSAVCRDRRFEPRIRAAFERFRAQPVDIPRVFDRGIPVVEELPERNWVCFYLARTLGYLGDPRSVDPLVRVLEQEPPEGASGHPDPLGPGVLFLHNELTPCWRAAVAWALGRIGQRRASKVLVRIVGDLDYAPDTRHAAAEALRAIDDPAVQQELARLARDYPEVATRRVLRRAGAGRKPSEAFAAGTAVRQ